MKSQIYSSNNFKYTKMANIYSSLTEVLITGKMGFYICALNKSDVKIP